MKGDFSSYILILLEYKLSMKESIVKKFLLVMAMVVVGLLLSVQWVSAVGSPKSTVTFSLITGLPAVMQVGQSYTVIVEVKSTQEYMWAKAMPDDQYPGKGVVSSGGTRSGAGTSSTLSVVFKAKSSTSGLPGGMDQVAVLAGVRLLDGTTASERFDFSVVVP